MKQILLTKGRFALVDDEDSERVSTHKWCLLKVGDLYYARRNKLVNQAWKTELMHRVVMNAEKGQQLDHIDGDGLNNTKANLRFCTHSQNIANSTPMENCSSKYKGVYWNRQNKKWRAQIILNGKGSFLGSFNSQIEAAKAYDKKAKEVFGEFARTNF